MAWTGKIIGGVLGSLIGPWGTAIGIGIGHQFDKEATAKQQTGMVIHVTFFGCLAKMAKADGQITAEEIQIVEQLIHQMGYSAEMRAAAIHTFRQAKDDQHSAGDYITQLAQEVQFNPQIAMTFLVALHAMAQADGFIHPNERDILHQAERAFRLRAGTVDAMLGETINGRSSNKLQVAYETMDCSAEMSDAEIKKTYRQKCTEFHPDKLASKGLPDEFMKYAHEQLTKINEAYDTIKKARA